MVEFSENLNFIRTFFFEEIHKFIDMKNYLFLALAILCESVATSFLKASEGFTKTIADHNFCSCNVCIILSSHSCYKSYSHRNRLCNLVSGRYRFDFPGGIFCLQTDFGSSCNTRNCSDYCWGYYH